MVLGHFAVALAAKRVAPRTSLGTTIFAAQLLDLVWPIFLLLGVERVRIVPGLMAANPLDFVHYPYTHSLAAAAGWALLFGLGYYLLRRYPTGAVVAGGLVLSHWLLDVPMHRPDLPLWPGSEVMVGGGLWNSVPATIVLELGLFALGLGIYLRSTRARNRIGRYALWAMAALLVLVFLSGFFGSAPPSEQALAVMGLMLWLFVPWGYWVDRHRDTTVPLSESAAPSSPASRNPTNRWRRASTGSGTSNPSG